MIGTRDHAVMRLEREAIVIVVIPDDASARKERARLEHGGAPAIAHHDVQPRATRRIRRRQLVACQIRDHDIRDDASDVRRFGRH